MPKNAPPLQKVICLMGPTGAGKSALAVLLAQEFNGVIINADSRQVYRDFPVITAQPSPAERAACPHELYGFLSTQEKISAGAYSRLAGEAIAAAAANSRLPIIVGGTGLYFKTLLDGIAPIPPVPPKIASAIQTRCDFQGSIALHAELALHDPDYAAKIHPNDRQRITRALEVLTATGRTLTWWHRQQPDPNPYNPLRIAITLPLDELTPRLHRRIDNMLAQGAIQEARDALQRQPDPHAPGWSGIGCAELIQYLTNAITLPECLEQWKNHTRAYAKRQMTWFKKQDSTLWLHPSQLPVLLTGVTEFLNAG